MNKGMLGWCATVGATLALAACGSSAPTRSMTTRAAAARSAAAHRKADSPPICISTALDAMARYLKVRPATIATAASTGNNAMPQCSYTAHLRHGKRAQVTANVDTSPSPYAVLERTIEEASQIFGPDRLSTAPINVGGLGLAASWFPEEDWLKTTDGVRLLTASVDWNGARQRKQIALATAVARPYHKTPHGGVKCGQTLYCFS
jgi:hypothetical protein